jgi:hypothetical protein
MSVRHFPLQLALALLLLCLPLSPLAFHVSSACGAERMLSSKVGRCSRRRAAALLAGLQDEDEPSSIPSSIGSALAGATVPQSYGPNNFGKPADTVKRVCVDLTL